MLSHFFLNPKHFLLHPASNLPCSPPDKKTKSLEKNISTLAPTQGVVPESLSVSPFCWNICLSIHTAVLRLFLFVNGFFSPLLFREQCLNLLPRSALISCISQHIFLLNFFAKANLVWQWTRLHPAKWIILTPHHTLFIRASLDRALLLASPGSRRLTPLALSYLSMVLSWTSDLASYLHSQKPPCWDAQWFSPGLFPFSSILTPRQFSCGPLALKATHMQRNAQPQPGFLPSTPHSHS